jgi:hypothetical protein
MEKIAPRLCVRNAEDEEVEEAKLLREEKKGINGRLNGWRGARPE